MASSSEQPVSVPPPPPPSGLAPPPPPPLGGPGGAPKNSTAKGTVWKKPSTDSVPAEEVNDRLLADIRAGVNLKPTKTRDRSSAVIRRKGNFK